MRFRSATVVLAALTAFVSLLITVGRLDAQAVGAMGFIPARLSGTLEIPGAVPAVLTPFSATLVHGGWLHLLFNIAMLLLCGAAVERALGTVNFVVIYTLSAMVAALTQWAINPSGLVPMIGASGAISGVIAAYALSFGRPKWISSSPRVDRAAHLLWLAAVWTALQVGVAWAAGLHGILLATATNVGGFIAGLLLQRPLLLWRYRKA